MSSWLQAFLRANQRLAHAFDRLILGADDRRYGTSDFHQRLLPAYLQDGMTVYDIGGGKTAQITQQFKAERRLHVTGVDIDETELAAAQAGLYDATLLADITRTAGPGNGDAVITRSTLEHVTDTRAAIANMATFLKPGGILIAFAPCRNAAFARLNALLPEGVKRRLLAFLYPAEQAQKMGFPAFYDGCTPSQLSQRAAQAGLEEIERVVYWHSNYFTFFAPVHIVWRICQMAVRAAGWQDGCEGMAFVWRKPS